MLIIILLILTLYKLSKNLDIWGSDKLRVSKPFRLIRFKRIQNGGGKSNRPSSLSVEFSYPMDSLGGVQLFC